jgi:hypothetical protein
MAELRFIEGSYKIPIDVLLYISAICSIHMFQCALWRNPKGHHLINNCDGNMKTYSIYQCKHKNKLKTLSINSSGSNSSQ